MTHSSLPGQSNDAKPPAVFIVAFSLLCAQFALNLLLQIVSGAFLRILPVGLGISLSIVVLLVALWARKAWAHFIMMVLIALGAAGNIMFLLSADFSRIQSASPEVLVGLGMFVVQLVVNFWLFYALNRSDVRLWCHRKA